MLNKQWFLTGNETILLDPLKGNNKACDARLFSNPAGVRSPCKLVSTVVPYGLMRLYYWIHWKAVTKLVMPVSYPILRGFDPLSVDSFVPNAGVRSPRLVSIAFVSRAGVRSPCSLQGFRSPLYPTQEFDPLAVYCGGSIPLLFRSPRRTCGG